MAMTVEEIARRTIVNAATVRYYTRIGLLSPGRHPANGYRLYGESDVLRLKFIGKAKWLGFSLSEIKQLIECAEIGKPTCRLARQIVSRRVIENRRRIAALSVLQLNMEMALGLWEVQPEDAPNGRTICSFIESIELEECSQPGPYAANQLPNDTLQFIVDEPATSAVD